MKITQRFSPSECYYNLGARDRSMYIFYSLSEMLDLRISRGQSIPAAYEAQYCAGWQEALPASMASQERVHIDVKRMMEG